jgi:hypothetical protein
MPYDRKGGWARFIGPRLAAIPAGDLSRPGRRGATLPSLRGAVSRGAMTYEISTELIGAAGPTLAARRVRLAAEAAAHAAETGRLLAEHTAELRARQHPSDHDLQTLTWL